MISRRSKTSWSTCEWRHLFLIGSIASLLGVPASSAWSATSDGDRLIEYYFEPAIAARGFTGVADCSGLACLDFNPALLRSLNEDINITASTGVRFNYALFNTLNNWSQTEALLASSQYQQILLSTWNFISLQTAKIDMNLGVEVQGFALSYAPVEAGALLFSHDPVLPYADLYEYAYSSLSLGYGYQSKLPKFSEPYLSALDLGASVKYGFGQTNRFTFDQFTSEFENVEQHSDSWVVGRLGATAVLKSSHYLALSAVVSGIPIYKNVLTNLPNNDYFDVQPGLAFKFDRFWWGDLGMTYSLSRVFYSDDFWLKQHLGITGNIGKFEVSAGVNDAIVSYGMSLQLPLFKLSVASYGVSYSDISGLETDRIYWIKLEI